MRLSTAVEVRRTMLLCVTADVMLSVKTVDVKLRSLIGVTADVSVPLELWAEVVIKLEFNAVTGTVVCDCKFDCEAMIDGLTVAAVTLLSSFAATCQQQCQNAIVPHSVSTHTRLTAIFFPGQPRSAGTRKIKPMWILLKQETVSGSGISWAICKPAPGSRQKNHASTPALSFLQAGCPSCRPTNSIKALKANIVSQPGTISYQWAANTDSWQWPTRRPVGSWLCQRPDCTLSTISCFWCRCSLHLEPFTANCDIRCNSHQL